MAVSVAGTKVNGGCVEFCIVFEIFFLNFLKFLLRTNYCCELIFKTVPRVEIPVIKWPKRSFRTGSIISPAIWYQTSHQRQAAAAIASGNLVWYVYWIILPSKDGINLKWPLMVAAVSPDTVTCAIVILFADWSHWCDGWYQKCIVPAVGSSSLCCFLLNSSEHLGSFITLETLLLLAPVSFQGLESHRKCVKERFWSSATHWWHMRMLCKYSVGICKFVIFPAHVRWPRGSGYSRTLNVKLGQDKLCRKRVCFNYLSSLSTGWESMHLHVQSWFWWHGSNIPDQQKSPKIAT